ncbi:Ig-like domain-containing protein [Deinococcus yavapaiensis]|uniref:Ig-like protein group 2 n=1 Tax=Deinococcus yavapaiensis KR-236 TaxID=694435 RepID=A0A318SE57_9DEIO|nr:Ig-like domain-containing protein [Deinococcus yavapaiensis]PYE51048.1 Ig-like protein group 2 [Deinococcus yavapaiensis KR-236]
MRTGIKAAAPTGLLVLTLTLAACNTGPTTPTPSSIDLTGTPASNKAKVNGTYDLDATVKGTDGTTIPSATVTWTSSDTNVATVDANGVVTIKKLGDTSVTITASTGSVTRSVQLDTYGLDLAVGTYNLAVTDTPTIFGTIFAKVRRPDGTAPTPAAAVTLTGPTGWNNNQTVTLNVPAINLPNKTFTAATYASPAVAGTYRATTTINGEVYEDTAVLDVAQVLPTPTNVTVTAASTTSVSATWNAVPGATTYYLQVYDCTGNLNSRLACTLLTSVNVGGATQGTLNNLTLTAGAGKTYTVGVRAHTVNPEAVDVSMPTTYLVSFAGKDFQLP